MKRTTSLMMFGFAIAGVISGLAAQKPSAKNTQDDERTIREADAAGLKGAQANDADRAVSNYADDADWLLPNAPTAHGKQAIRAGWSQLLSAPGLKIDWQITKLEISRSHDMAYTLYAYQMSMLGPDGKSMQDHGKDMAVWRKQTDGSWKIAADTYSSDLPAQAPAKTL